MKSSYQWLSSYLPLDAHPKKVGNALLLSSFEVEDVAPFAQGLEQIIIGKVVGLKAHPDADKLRVATVKIGKIRKNTIVCGAPNVAVGQHVAVALPGVTLPNGMKIEEREIRGVGSKGMIASEDELGLSEEHAGIMTLPLTTKIGSKLIESISLEDSVFDIDITSNRPDAYSHIGLARELAAIYKKKLTLPKTADSRFEKKQLKKLPIDISVEDAKVCPLYEAVVISNVSVTDSPQWMKNYLFAVGQRPINNIVDASNFVLLEFGQPTHAFDYDVISGRQIQVRQASEGEHITTLDEVDRKLDSSMMVIADKKKPIAIAGVMGGLESMVKPETTSIVLESAIFNAVSVRRTSRKLGLQTDASLMFERGISSRLPNQAIARFIELIKETCPEASVGNFIRKGSLKEKKENVILELSAVKRVLGIDIPRKEIEAILVSLEFSINKKDIAYKSKEYQNEHISVDVPHHRLDIHIQEDLVEEIGRIYGYNNIPHEMSQTVDIIPQQRNTIQQEEHAKDLLVASGYSEVYNKSFVSKSEISSVGIPLEDHFELQNPVSPDQAYMRGSLLESIGRVISTNQKYFEEFSLFEFGRSYIRPQISDKPTSPAKEMKSLIIAKSVRSGEPYYDLKKTVDGLFQLFHIAADRVRVSHQSKVEEGKKTNIENSSFFHPSKSARIVVDDQIIGYIGTIHPRLAQSLKISPLTVVCELYFEDVVRLRPKYVSFSKISQFPSSSLDVSFVVDREVASQDVLQTITSFAKKIFSGVELLDVYEGDAVEKGKKSLSFRITYQSDEKTLTDEEVKRVHNRVVDGVVTEHDATIRD